MDTVEKIREMVDTSLFEEQVAAYDLTESFAAILDGVNRLDRPGIMQNFFGNAWGAYARLWAVEHMAALEAMMGEERHKRLLEHEEQAEITRRIFERIGGLKPGQSFKDIDVEDILSEAGI